MDRQPRDRARSERTAPSFVFGYEEALGYTVGTLVRDKDGVGAALVIAELAAWWTRARGTTVAGYLEEIQREFGRLRLEAAELHAPGRERRRDHPRVMEAFRRSRRRASGSRAVEWVKDYKARTPRPARGAPSL